MIKKLLSFFIVLFLLSLNYTYGNNIEKDSTYFSYMKNVINSTNGLNNSEKGKEYLSLIDNYINSSSESNIRALYNKLEVIDETGVKNTLNRNIITYLKYRIFISVDYKKSISEGYEDLSIYIITDKRNTNSDVEYIISELNSINSINNATMLKFDFYDDGIKEYLEYVGIETLPAVIFSTNNFDTSKDVISYDYYGNSLPSIKSYLVGILNNDYYLNVGSTYNPFIERSDRGFLKISQDNLDEIIDNSYIYGEKDVKFIWIEYSDLECPYCAKFHNDGTQSTVMDEYEGDISLVFNHFPLSFHANASIGAEILECFAEQKGSDSFYDLINISFSSDVDGSSKDFLIEEAYNLGADKEKIEICLSEGRYSDKVDTQMTNGDEIFSISGTPGSVIINTETLEYEVVSGAFPASTFIDLIERLK